VAWKWSGGTLIIKMIAACALPQPFSDQSIMKRLPHERRSLSIYEQPAHPVIAPKANGLNPFRHLPEGGNPAGI
jgi:hypothetical protein